MRSPRASAMSCVGGIRSGRDTTLETSVYAPISARSDTRPRRVRCFMLSADRVHHVLVLDHLPRITMIDDLAAIDGVEPVGNPAGVGEIRFGDQDRDPHLLDLPHRLDEPGHYHRSEPLEGLVEQED